MMARDPAEILHTVFGFSSFRGVQEAVIADVCSGRDVALVMPTGAGKSICYQVPSLVRPGCGIIVSPLIALMAEQVQALKLLGVRAKALNSQTENQWAVIQKFRAGELDMLYVAPERANSESFHRLASEAKVALLAIDEAHCVSQWGHDFRPDYRRLRGLADILPQVPRIALTATADAMTRADICAQLGIAPDRLTIAGFDRPNIRYQVRLKRQPQMQLLSFVKSQTGKAGIVYCQTRAETERTAEALNSAGVPALAYHAGLDPDVRRRNQRLFQSADDMVMVATIAFGMGIDKPDVRFVAHMGLPKSIEAYYQETGRAGRDGEPAIAHMLWGPDDIQRARQRIDASTVDEERKQHEYGQISRLAAFAETLRCRRVPLLTHFGEAEPPACGNCDNCLEPPALRDVSEPARKLLSAVYRTGQMFGLSHLAKVLRGANDERVERHGHDKLSVFGIGRDLHETQWMRLGRKLEADGVMARDAQHGGLRLADSARPILRGESRVAVRAEDWEPRRKDRSRDGVATEINSLAPADEKLFADLREWRRQQAATDQVPAYVIFHDSTLKAIAEAHPQNRSDLSGISGVGTAKISRYGDAILKVVADSC
ncbi:MAG: DNA helicase RecQ [Sphingomonadaceae bacterium]